MAIYQHLLFATDLTPDSKKLAFQALQLSKLFGAQLSLVSAVEYMPIMGDSIVTDFDWLKSLKENAIKELALLGKQLSVPVEKQHVLIEKTSTAILTTAKEQNVDLIIVGKRIHHGLEKLLGATANGILNQAHCDVLTLRVNEE